MANLTTKDLSTALQKNNETIFKYIKQNNKVLVKRIDQVVHARLSEASDAILHTIDANRDEANQKFETLSKDMKDVKQDIKFIRHDISDIEAEMSLKPSRKQFEEFKSKFDNYPTL